MLTLLGMQMHSCMAEHNAFMGVQAGMSKCNLEPYHEWDPHDSQKP